MPIGLPIFKLARKSIKGWFPCSKGGKNKLIPFIGINEEKFLYYVENNPNIIYIERADINDDFADTYKLHRSSLIPIVIPYKIEGKSHDYYPDFFVKMRDGRTIVVEAGDKEEKEKPIPCIKAYNALNYCRDFGWEYWLIKSDKILSKNRMDNYVLLQSYSKPFYRNDEIIEKIKKVIKGNGNFFSIDGVVEVLKHSYTPKEVELALYYLLNELTKEGKLGFNFDAEVINRRSWLEVAEENRDNSWEFINVPYSEIENYQDNYREDEIELEDENKYLRSFIDSDYIPEEFRDEFFLRRTAVLEAISFNAKDNKSMIAKKYGLKRSTLYLLIDKYIRYGDTGLIPYSQYNGVRTSIPEEMQGVIKKLVYKHSKWSVVQIAQSDELKEEVLKLSKKNNKVYIVPSYYSIYRFLKSIKDELDYDTSNTGAKKEKSGFTTVGKWVKSIGGRLDAVQVDAHWIDIKIVTQDREDVAGRVWAVALVDVKTSMFLGYSLSLKSPMEEDYMAALKCCIEPKDQLTTNYKCKKAWPCKGIPRKLLSDNGKIFISHRSTDVVAKRLRIVEEIAPPYAPSIKGSIEVIFKWIVEKLVSRLPGFTKGRDPEVVKKEALDAGITLQVFEELFVRAIVDVYNQEWDYLRGQTAFNLWVAEDQNNALLPPEWIGTKDELKLLLMKEEESRKVDRHGISFRGRLYQNVTMLRSIDSKHVSIRYDKRDISVLYVYLDDGIYYCEVYCDDLRGKRLSVWEDEILKKNLKLKRDFHNNIAGGNLTEILKDGRKCSKKRKKEREAQQQEQALLYSSQDIHTENVNKQISSSRPEAFDSNREIEPIPINTKNNIRKLEVRDI